MTYTLMLQRSRKVEGVLLVSLSVRGVTKDYRFKKSTDVISVIIIIIIIIMVTLVLISVIDGVKLKISKYFSHNYASKNRSQKDY